MSDQENCKCMQSTYEFVVYRVPYRWWHTKAFFGVAAPNEVQFGFDRKRITIHADSLTELERKRDDIKKQLEKKHGDKYEVSVYLA